MVMDTPTSQYTGQESCIRTACHAVRSARHGHTARANAPASPPVGDCIVASEASLHHRWPPEDRKYKATFPVAPPPVPPRPPPVFLHATGSPPPVALAAGQRWRQQASRRPTPPGREPGDGEPARLGQLRPGERQGCGERNVAKHCTSKE